VNELDRLSDATRMLAEVQTATQAWELIRTAEAARQYAKLKGLGAEAISYAADIKARAMVLLADFVDAGQRDGTIASKGRPENLIQSQIKNLKDLLPDSADPAHDVYEARKLRDQLARGETAKNIVRSDVNEWYTPAIYVEAARRVLGGIDLDPASSPEANATIQAKIFYTEDDDGLEQIWGGRIWLNPPYGRQAAAFVTKLIAAWDAGQVAAAVAVVNAHCTDTEWFRPLWDHLLCFTYGRVDFHEGGPGRGGSTHGTVFAYLGQNPWAFRDEFADFGACVRRWDTR